MPKKVKAGSQMYQGWITHTKGFLKGACPHACTYCYVQAMAKRFAATLSRHSGPVALDPAALTTPLGQGRTIFIEHLNDLWADAVPAATIEQVLSHCRNYPKNRYVFQTKNPARYLFFLEAMPAGSTLGITLETNRHLPAVMGQAPAPCARVLSFAQVPGLRFTKFVTVEPILECDPATLAEMINECCVHFVNIGADSKGIGLPEPEPGQVLQLIYLLGQQVGLQIRHKTNLSRLLL